MEGGSWKMAIALKVHPFLCLTFFCLSPRRWGKRIGGKGMAALFSLASGISDERFRVLRVFLRSKNPCVPSRPTRKATGAAKAGGRKH